MNSACSVCFVVLNMDKNTERLDSINKMFDEIGCHFTRIKAINGFDMQNDNDAKTLLRPRKDLFGKKFKNLSNGKMWVYDGTMASSWPNISLNGHHGTKGLTLSNLKAFEFGLKQNCKFLCVLEDDAVIDQNSYRKIISFVENPINSNVGIVLLDARHNGWGGTAGMLYNSKILNQLLTDLHPLSIFSMSSERFGDKNLGNLWDWKLWKYCKYINKNFKTLPCIKSGMFVSEINKLPN